jgi:hypothetical protein
LKIEITVGLSHQFILSELMKYLFKPRIARKLIVTESSCPRHSPDIPAPYIKRVSAQTVFPDAPHRADFPLFAQAKCNHYERLSIK